MNKSIERRPRVPHYQSAILSTIAATLQPALLPEPASRARDAPEAAQYAFPLWSHLQLKTLLRISLTGKLVPV